MVYKITFAFYANNDLTELKAYVTDSDGPDNAKKLIAQIKKRIASLKKFPSRGSIPIELHDTGRSDIRQAIVGNYRIIYRIKGSEVRILLLADARRDFRSIMSRRMFGF